MRFCSISIQIDSAISKFLHHVVFKYLPRNSVVFLSMSSLWSMYCTHLHVWHFACKYIQLASFIKMFVSLSLYIYYLYWYYCMWLTMRYMRSCHMYLLWMERAGRGPSFLCKWRWDMFFLVGTMYHPFNGSIQFRANIKVNATSLWKETMAETSKSLTMRTKSVGWNLCPNFDDLVDWNCKWFVLSPSLLLKFAGSSGPQNKVLAWTSTEMICEKRKHISHPTILSTRPCVLVRHEECERQERWRINAFDLDARGRGFFWNWDLVE